MSIQLTKRENTPIEDAVSSGNVEALGNLIASGHSAKEHDSDALRLAAARGYVEMVKMLIPVSHPRAMNSRPLIWAAKRGHLDCVKELIPVSDPKTNDSRPLQHAVRNGDAEMIRFLIPFSDVVAATEALKSRGEPQSSIELLNDLVEEVSLRLQAGIPTSGVGRNVKNPL